ncbi:MAG: DedA family protein [Nanoarchaeota archaeon]
MVSIIDLLLHIDKYIGIFLQQSGPLTYWILFLIIFIETGVVFFPFLPGDSLLFVAGTFSSQGLLNPIILFITLSTAAILGDGLNYYLGKFFGEKIIRKFRFLKEEYLEKTKEFYKLHGGKTIIYARFIPIVRTFAPFVAGIGGMEYKKFLSYNVIGAVLWVGLLVFSGYFFGNITLVKENLHIIIYLIIFVSLIPPIIEWLRHKIRKKKQPKSHK